MQLQLVFLVVFVVFLGSLTRSTFGFGDSVVSMPLLALLPIPLSLAISLIGLTGLSVGLIALFSARKHIDRRILFLLLASTLVGIPIGLYLVTNVPQESVTRILGVFLFFYGLYSLFKQRLSLELPQRWKESSLLPLPFGLLSGILGSAYNMNGVPIVVYGTFRDWEMETFQSTLQTHFIFSSLLVVFGHAVSGLWSKDLLLVFVASLPAVYLAHKLGHGIRKRMPVRQFEVLLFIFITVLGVLLFFSAA